MGGGGDASTLSLGGGGDESTLSLGGGGDEGASSACDGSGGGWAAAMRGKTSVNVGALAAPRAHVDLSAQRAREAPRERQAHARALVAPPVARLELMEVLEELLQRVRGDADARVAHGDLHLVGRGSAPSG